MTGCELEIKKSPIAPSTPTATPTPGATATPTPTPTPTPAPVSASYSLSNGWSTLVLSVTLNTAGSVYWAAYNADPGTLTAAQVKATSSSCTGACVSAATIAVSAGASPADGTFSTLPDQVFYTVFAVAENTVGLDTDANVKKYTYVIPRKISLQTFNSSRSGTPIIRHWLYYPPNYYNTTSTYPSLMYIHGGGETSSNASNAEADFTTDATRMDKIPFYPTIFQGTELPFVAFAAQCNSAIFSCINGDDTAFHNEVATRIRSYSRINLKKQYVYGMSWGGAGTWAYAYDYPADVTAIVPMAGGLMGRSTANLCTKFVTNHVSVWGFTNATDPWYSSTTISGGTYSGGAVTVLQGCAGHSDARYTEMPGNIYPATVNGHNTLEYVLGIPYYHYSGGAWFYNNSGANTFDLALPGIPAVGHFVPLAPQVSADLATASTDLGSTITSIYEWMLLQTKP